MTAMTANRPTILLIPGAWHTPDYFDAVRAYLEKHAYPTMSCTLPSINCTDPANHSAQTDAAFIRNQILTPLLDGGKRVVLAMHSYGGRPGSAAAYGLSEGERQENGLIGGLIGLVFIAAFVLPSGPSVSDWEPTPLVGFSVDEIGNSTITPSGAVQNFYNELQPASTAQSWGTRISSLAVNVLGSPVKEAAHEQAAFRGRMSYIYTVKDNAIPLEQQKSMVAATGIENVATLNTDHSPFLTMPERTAEILMEQIGCFV